MKIELPYVSQADLEYAIDCLEACKQKNAKKYGFNEVNPMQWTRNKKTFHRIALVCS
jgi:hypothetical protein